MRVEVINALSRITDPVTVHDVVARTITFCRTMSAPVLEPLFRHSFSAMATEFEVFLTGDDGEHLEAVAAAVADEVVRIERRLSRFDPTSEVSRINREAGTRSVRLDREVWELLVDCERFRRWTDGGFDVAVGALLLDESKQTVRLTRPDARIDLGGVGKGWAIDRCGAILRRFGVAHGLLNAGTSSILAVGGPWTVDVRNPTGGAEAVARLNLIDQAFSCSAVVHPGECLSDLYDPRTGRSIEGRAACMVLAATATEAEALSTGLLVLGREVANDWLLRRRPDGVSVGWIETGRFEWLGGAT